MIYNSNNLKGRTLGNCMLQELIGRGGMSAVYVAQQRHLSRQVAVKILLPNVSIGSKLHDQFLLRFQHEAAIIAKLDHINIVPIYEYAKQDGNAYLVMPYLTGGSLHSLLSRYGSLSLQQTLNYIEQAASALDYAHLHGVIHRDLKPGNFLLHADGRLVLADFGIAHIVRESGGASYPTLTGPDLLLGTPDYMSPEMVRGERVDHRSDIYELGIVLFQMLSGDIPFKANNPNAVLLKRLQEPVPLLNPMNPSIPPAVDDVIQKATAVNREERFTSAGELARALQRAIAEPLLAFRITPLPSSTVPIEPSLPTYLSTIEGQAPFPGHAATKRHALHSLSSTTVARESREVKTWGKFIGLALVASFIFIASGIFLVNAKVSPPQVSKSSTPAPSDLAKNTVQQFYDDIDHWKYPQAFKLLSGNYCSFVDGYAYTLHDKVIITGVAPAGNGTYNVAITLQATELLSSGRVISTYYGNQIVKHETDGTWKIVGGGSIRKTQQVPDPVTPLVDPGASSSQQAQAVIQQFYNDINIGDYPDAYSSWQSADQNPSGYCSFINGYAHTRHDDVTIKTVTPQADGTVSVAFTLLATEDNESGVKTYQRIDHVGKNRYGMWKIL